MKPPVTDKRQTEHYRQTTAIIYDWFSTEPQAATARSLYERLDAVGLLFTEEMRAGLLTALLAMAADFLDQEATRLSRATAGTCLAEPCRHEAAGMREAAKLLRDGAMWGLPEAGSWLSGHNRLAP